MARDPFRRTIVSPDEQRLANGIGRPVQRKEDLRLLRGQGCFSDDWRMDDEVYSSFVRSTRSHAGIRAIHAEEAMRTRDVIAVFTGADLAADGLLPIPSRAAIKDGPDVKLYNSDGSPIFTTPQPLLPIHRARFVGEALAMVVARTKEAAQQASERVVIDYDELECVTCAREAMKPDAPILWPDHGSNICIDAQIGDQLGTEAAFTQARHVVRLSTWVQRVTGAPLEPRAALGVFDSSTGVYTLYSGGGGVVRHKDQLMAALNAPTDMVRVVNRDVGGSFGTRNNFYREAGLVCWAARKVGHPVKWTSTRQECFLSDYQGRDLAVDAELALDEDGRFLAVRSTNVSNVGGYTVAFTPLTKGAGLMSSNYAIPFAHVRALAVMTNTTPTSSYRSAGRPEAIFVIERLIDLAADALKMDRIDIRRRNLIAPVQLPFANPLGLIYDNGDYRAVMEKAAALCDLVGFAHRRRESERKGLCRGFGIANYIEITTGDPRERAEIAIKPEGWVELVIGTQSAGQGHETSFAQLLCEWLQVEFEDVRLVQGDTDRVRVGGGSHSGRSMRLAGIVIGEASGEILKTACAAAAELLEVAPEDLAFSLGSFIVNGADRSIHLYDIARAIKEGRVSRLEPQAGLAAACEKTTKLAGFPYGSHACEVEVDPETGCVELVRYVAVDDVGRAVNPMILHGQARGGAAQGIGQALLEEVVYDRRNGQVLTGSFMDYALPRAHDLPQFITHISESPAPGNPLGVRAGGEGGTTPALAVVIGAIVDALSGFGVKHIEMPATPERVWRAIDEARRAPS